MEIIIIGLLLIGLFCIITCPSIYVIYKVSDNNNNYRQMN